MFFVLHAFDKDGALPKRLSNYEAHKGFLADTSPYGVSIFMRLSRAIVALTSPADIHNPSTRRRS